MKIREIWYIQQFPHAFQQINVIRPLITFIKLINSQKLNSCLRYKETSKFVVEIIFSTICSKIQFSSVVYLLLTGSEMWMLNTLKFTILQKNFSQLFFFFFLHKHSELSCGRTASSDIINIVRTLLLINYVNADKKSNIPQSMMTARMMTGMLLFITTTFIL